VRDHDQASGRDSLWVRTVKLDQEGTAAARRVALHHRPRDIAGQTEGSTDKRRGATPRGRVLASSPARRWWNGQRGANLVARLGRFSSGGTCEVHTSERSDGFLADY
jgi:hypothetical protein